jgi:hypothetical protein
MALFNTLNSPLNDYDSSLAFSPPISNIPNYGTTAIGVDLQSFRRLHVL